METFRISLLSDIGYFLQWAIKSEDEPFGCEGMRGRDFLPTRKDKVQVASMKNFNFLKQKDIFPRLNVLFNLFKFHNLLKLT